MIVRVRYFSSVRERIGKQYDNFDVGDKISVKDLKELIKKRYPQVFDKYPIIVSINYKYSEDDEIIRKGDEISLMPGISGG